MKRNVDTLTSTIIQIGVTIVMGNVQFSVQCTNVFCTKGSEIKHSSA